MKNVNEDFEIYKNQMVSLTRENRREDARRLISESSEQLHENFTLVLRDITASYDAELENSLVEMSNNTQRKHS